MNKNAIGFSIAGSLLCIAFFITANMTINQISGIDSIWFIYPVFAVVWWPLSLVFHACGRYREYSVVSSLLIILFLVVTNYVTSPGHPWFLYAAYPILWWPITLYTGRKAASVGYALIGSAATILYYTVLNLLIAPGYPWAIYPAFAVLWWPLSMYFARRKKLFAYSIVGSLLTILFIITVNYVSSPQSIWAIYPAFGVIWWPLAMYYFYYRRIPVQ